MELQDAELKIREFISDNFINTSRIIVNFLSEHTMGPLIRTVKGHIAYLSEEKEKKSGRIISKIMKYLYYLQLSSKLFYLKDTLCVLCELGVK